MLCQTYTRMRVAKQSYKTSKKLELICKKQENMLPRKEEVNVWCKQRGNNK